MTRLRFALVRNYHANDSTTKRNLTPCDSPALPRTAASTAQRPELVSPLTLTLTLSITAPDPSHNRPFPSDLTLTPRLTLAGAETDAQRPEVRSGRASPIRRKIASGLSLSLLANGVFLRRKQRAWSDQWRKQHPAQMTYSERSRISARRRGNFNNTKLGRPPCD